MEETQGYRITFEEESQEYSPNYAYGMSHMNGCKFSTAQVENHIHATVNCGQLFGPWWHKDCHQEAMNGKYSFTGTPTSYANGIIWAGWKTLSTTLRRSTIMIRPRSFST